MDSKLKGAFTLSSEEWSILAFGLGVPSIIGFPKMNTPPDREKVLRAVSGLINKEFIQPEGDNFRVLSPYREAVLRTGDSKTLFIRTRSDRLPDVICYSGESLLLCEPMPQQSGVYRFAFADPEEFWERLLSAGYFPEDDDAPGDEMDLKTAADREDELLSDMFQNKSLNIFSPAVFWMERVTAEKQDSEFLAVVEHPLFRYMLTDMEGERTRQLFDSAKMRILFLNFLKGVTT